jgi:hypothetical protein
MICEAQMNLNDHNTFVKAYKRKKRASMIMRNRKKRKKRTDRFWLTCTNPAEKTSFGEYIPQGYVEVGLEVMSKTQSEKLKNEQGRDSPNAYPRLPPPKGRFKFNLFLLGILGFGKCAKRYSENLSRKLILITCYIICLVLFILFMVYGGGFMVSQIWGGVVSSYVTGMLTSLI